MIKALENNTIGLVLTSLAGALLAVCLGLIVAWALPPSAGSGGDDPAEGDITADITSLQSARPLEDYGVISDRPVFNEDRRPSPVDDSGVEDPGLLPGEEVPPPDVELAGIIITPTVRMATLRLKEQPLSLVAFEGEPLEGDFGTWQVSRIGERTVMLASDEGEELQLELQVHDAMIKAPPELAKPSAEPEALAGEEGETQPEDSEASEPMTRAEEIRQRIEERREELRRAAEERDAAQAENYRDAIQSMIQRSQQRTQDDQTTEDG